MGAPATAPPHAAPASNGVHRQTSAEPLTFPPSFWSGFHKKALRERQDQLRLCYPHLFPPPSSTAASPRLSSTVSSKAASTDPDAHSPPPAHSRPLHANGALARTDSTASLQQSKFGSGVSLAALNVDHREESFPIRGLDEQIANNMIDTMGLPVGLALNFVINSKPLVIPMVVEEPSVVAAVSGAAKTFAPFGGFTASTSERNTKQQIIQLANSFVPNMSSRGGGVVDVTVRTPPVQPLTSRPRRPREVKVVNPPSTHWLVVHLHVDVCDAMGANAASAVAEGIAPFLADLVGARIGLRIVSNLCVQRMAKSTFKIPLSKLAYKSFSGRQVAERIIEAGTWAEDDCFRATTHNKGIMNGIDAVAVATGQDWRAIEAAAHAWAAGCGRSEEKQGSAFGGKPYQPLTHYWVEQDDSYDENGGSDVGLFFCGELEMPISVGTKGGVLKTNPVYGYTLGIMGDPDSKTLAMAMVSVGLAQNFAALRALSTEGIQRGHMSLHARNIAIAAGAPPHAINECVNYMVESGRVNVDVAKEYLQAHEMHTSLTSTQIHLTALAADHSKASVAPSTFLYEEAASSTSADGRPFTLNIAFKTLGPKPMHLWLSPTSPETPLLKSLFGVRSFDWLSRTFGLLDKIAISTTRPGRSNLELPKKLKVLSVIINIVVRHLMAIWPAETIRLVELIQRYSKVSQLDDEGFSGRQLRPSSASARSRASSVSTPTKSPSDGDVRHAALQVGRPLVLALWQVFELRVLQWVGFVPLARALLEVELDVLNALVEAPLLQTHPYLSPQNGHADDEDDADDADDADEENDSDEGILINASTPSASTLTSHTASNSRSPTAPAPTSTAAHRFTSLMSVNARRFQCALLLLCDASSFDPLLLTPARARIGLVRDLAALLEWEQLCAHDLSEPRLRRDLAALARDRAVTRSAGLEPGAGPLSAFLFWLVEVRRRSVADVLASVAAAIGDDSEAATGARVAGGADDAAAAATVERVLSGVSLHAVFRDEMREFLRYASRNAELSRLTQTDVVVGLFGADCFSKVTSLYREYYEVAHLYDALLQE
ncbi:hypothetical protein DFJ73DRAFT_790615 [Zopfochytrium polystomum]|nr:hypothetical protein DFJ73DRAFT_790615 [Zopfochytrium polystomum]